MIGELRKDQTVKVKWRDEDRAGEVIVIPDEFGNLTVDLPGVGVLTPFPTPQVGTLVLRPAAAKALREALAQADGTAPGSN